MLNALKKKSFQTLRQKIVYCFYVVVSLGLFICLRQGFIFIFSPYIYGEVNSITPENILDANSLGNAMIDYLIFMVLLGAAELYTKQVNGLYKEKILVREKLQSELSFLKAQVNPHFLFNTLNNIYVLTRKQSPEAPDAVVKLSKLLRFTLYEIENKTIPLEKEIKIIEDYIALECIRYNNRLSINFEKKVEDHYIEIAPLLLLPFVENAFKHGISETFNSCFIKILLNVDYEMLHFTVENSKDNVLKTNLDTSIGLKNINRQLELIYPEHTLVVIEEPELFKIDLKVNLKKYVAL